MQGNSESISYNTILGHIEKADMLLIGLGEEFNCSYAIQKTNSYREMKDRLQEAGELWLMPAFQRIVGMEWDESIRHGLDKLCEAISSKNYFIVATSTNDLLCSIPWKNHRLVTPCGGSRMKQCSAACGAPLEQVTAEDWKAAEKYFKMTEISGGVLRGVFGACPKCGQPFILNNIYVDNYDESAYLEQWQLYTKWLQGTLNKKLLILELGVGMEYPSVVRWPFEKIAFYNQKALFYRINEHLYHLTPELNQKGTAIAENAIDWLQLLC